MKKQRGTSRRAIALIGLAIFVAASTARFSHAEEPASGVEAADEQIAVWIDALSDRDFNARSAATKHLIELGPRAIAPVAKAADTDDLERAYRCIDVLEALYRSEDQQTSTAAEEALRQLSRSDNRIVARAAERIIRKEQPLPDRNAPAPPAAGRNVRIQTRVVNGDREIDVTENDRTIHITDSGGKNITVTVTETVDGKKKSQESKAKDLDDLKKKHPEAAALYERYGAKNNVFQFQFGGINPVLPQNLRPRRPIILHPNQAEDFRKDFDRAQQHLTDALAELQRLSKNKSITPADLQKSLQTIERAQKNLEELRRRLD
ncbi:MAG: hypothetical protein ACREJB_08815 [Planctomycetaceae bacterium]